MDKQNWFRPTSTVQRVRLQVFLFLVVALLSIPALSFAQVADDLKQARRYLLKEEFAPAEQIYRNILLQSSDTAEVREANKQLIALYIASGQWDKVQAAYDALPSDISAGEATDTVGEMAYSYLNGKYPRALPMYQYIVNNRSQNEYAIWLQAAETISRIHTGDDPNAPAILAGIKADYANHPDLARVVNKIGDNYYKLKKYSSAIKLFRYVVEHQAEADFAIWSQKSLIACHLHRGDDAAVRQEMDNLLADFSGREKFGNVLKNLRGKFRDAKQYALMKVCQQRVVDAFPGSEEALWAQCEIALASIELGHETVQQADVQKLMATFADPEKQAEALNKVADRLLEAGKYQQAKQLYQDILTYWPQSEYALWAQKSLAICHINLGEAESAQAAVERLRTDFAGANQQVKAILEVTSAWGKRDIDKADQLCRAIIAGYPGDELTIKAHTYLGVLELRRGNLTSAETLFHIVLQNFTEHPRLVQAVTLMAEGYYDLAFTVGNQGDKNLKREYLRRAIAKWEYITTDLPETLYRTAQAYKMAADCYRLLEDYPKAVEYYQVVVDRWPAYKNAWHAQYLIGRCYDRMKKIGLMKQEDTDGETQIAYELLLQNYPECSTAKVARRWLDRHAQ